MSGEANIHQERPPVVVVGVDGSIQSEAALAWAADQARALNGTMRAVLVRTHQVPRERVLSQSVWPFPPVNQRNLGDVEPTREKLQELVLATLSGDQKPHYELDIRDGDVAAELLLAVREARAELLVVGRRGLGGFRSLVLGSVSNHCATHAQCPVVVLQGEVAKRGGTIVVGTDGSDPSYEAVTWAADQAQTYGAELRIVTVWETQAPPLGSIASLRMPPEGHEVYAKEANELIDAVLQRVRATHPGVVAQGEVVNGRAGAVLTQITERTDAQMLVVGTRGLGGFESRLLGSVARQCLEHSVAPVVVVRTNALT